MLALNRLANASPLITSLDTPLNDTISLSIANMSKVPPEEIERNLEFYKRWKIDGENIYELIREYGFSYPRAYVIKRNVETRPQYAEALKKLNAN